jgi:hypothetical protein
MKAKYVAFKVVKITLAVIVFGGLFVFGTMHLWNWLVPMLFKGPVINFWETLGLIVLSKILFGGFHSKGGHRWRGKHRMGEPWKQKIEEMKATMTEEEIEKWKSRCRNKF